ncbi:MAG: phosphomannomutase/phosphoglucomutase [Clostridia bacterium]|nr:phosphomannomutase/phosphoglucomutase [Clostridia bacterium]
MSLMKLKSGTDIRGTAVGENTELTDEAVMRIASAFISYLPEKTGVKKENITLAVGHDSRISALRIKNALLSVFAAEGIRVLDCGLSSTPAMFMTTVTLGVTASVQITASHHPYDKNGLKFFTKDGGFEGEDIKAVLLKADELSEVKTASPDAEKTDFMSQYSEILKKKIIDGISDGEKPLSGFHIVVDAGNGAGGFFRKLLDELGADTVGSQFLEPDGMFPNHIPNPEDKTAMGFICKAVTDNNADLGIIFDTDVDRAACVSSDGNEINRNALIALASVIALENSPGGTVVTDSVTSSGLREFINEQLHGQHYRYKRGYKNVINKAIELNREGIDCPLAIETSGHAALRENFFLDDGAYLMVKIIILMAKMRKEGKTLQSLLSSLKKPYEEKEIRYIIEEEDFRAYGEKVIRDFEEYCEQFPLIIPADDNREGFRVNFHRGCGDGWLLVRLSVHDPVIPVNMETDSDDGMADIERFWNGFIKNYEKLRKK